MYIKKIDHPPVAVNCEPTEKYRNNGTKRSLGACQKKALTG